MNLYGDIIIILNKNKRLLIFVIKIKHKNNFKTSKTILKLTQNH